MIIKNGISSAVASCTWINHKIFESWDKPQDLRKLPSALVAEDGVTWSLQC